MSRLTNCRSCGAPMIWTRTKNGKKMPVDADPVEEQRGFRLVSRDGEILEQEDIEGVMGEITAEYCSRAEPGERLYQSHHSTCPDSRDWKGGRR